MTLQATEIDLNGVQWRDPTPLMTPKSVAIIGASQRSSSALNRESRGNRVIRNLKNFGYPGRIVTGNPKYNEVMDCPCYPDIAAIPEPVACVVLAVANRPAPALLSSAGFAEIRGEGKERKARLPALSQERAFLICGPNCYGVLNVHGKAPLFASAIPPGFLAGSGALLWPS